jgi:hypothetical protein
VRSVQAFAYLLPALVLLLALLARRYPGERALARIARRRARPRRRPRAAVLAHHTRPRVSLPRGGRLIAASLAVRPPPHLLGAGSS